MSFEWYWHAVALGAALACGLLIGIERGFNLRNVPEGTRVAGVRTFTLLGLLSGVAGMVGEAGQTFAAGALIAGAVAIVSIGYAHRPELEARTDATSPVASVATLGFGFLAGSGNPALAVVGATLATLILALKSEVHRLVGQLDDEDVKALARFAVIAGAILPFLPDGNFGPYGAWNPQKLWLVVVLVTGFSFVGYAANRIFGARHGTIATAVIGGLYSSTAVTQSLSQRLGKRASAGPESAGIALASTVMYVRVLVLVAVLASRFFAPFIAIVTPALVVAAGAGIWLLKAGPRDRAPSPPGNPIAIVPALGFLLFVALAAVAAAWAEERFGQQGLALLLLITGSMDVDVAIVTAGGLAPDAISPLIGAIALAGTIVLNMAVKIGVTAAYAGRTGIPAIAALSASVLTLLAGILFALLRQ